MRYLDPDELPYAVRIVNDWIPLADGTRLWMKAWLPQTEEPVPAILEYLPYRSGDWTAPRDHERHPYYAGHGYASVRVDIRGHGNSTGVPGDEYDEQELDDGVEVIHWLAEQDWCSGAVGMFGISWGGFNSLMLASRRPAPLRAIVTTCSSDDRYDNDVHYFGGSMLAVDMHAWAATMLAFESRPPDPAAVGEGWKQQWLDRLERMDPYLDEWMRHQVRDDYWKRGSVCEDYDALEVPVLAVGGWFDPYRDTVLRLVENLSARGREVKGIIGPWAHQYPDRDLRPGPHIDFLGETLRWWDHWLKGEETTVTQEPLLRAWVTDSVRPSSVYEEMPGGWVAEESWPSPQVELRALALREGSAGPLAAISTDAEGNRLLRVDSPQDTGQAAGRYFPFGNAGDLPTDQRPDDGRATTVDFALREDLVLLGNAEAHLHLTCSTPRGQVYVRLTDVAPDGSSTLITRGNLNLASRQGRELDLDFPAGRFEDVIVPLTGIGYRLPAGHVLRVAISNAYWPWVWPQPGSGVVTVDLESSRIRLPVRRSPQPGSEAESRDRAVRFDEAVQPAPLEVEYPESGRAGAQRPERLISTDVVSRSTSTQVDPAYGGTRRYPDGLHYDEDTVETYRIEHDDPLSARTESRWRVGIRRPEIGWETSLEADTRIRCDAESFYTESSVRCFDGEEPVFERTWHGRIPRAGS